MRPLKSVLVAAAALVAMFGAIGCSASYTVDVRNRADQPVVVSLRQTRLAGGSGQSDILELRRVGPGDSRRIGPVHRDVVRNVYLEVDFAGNIDRPGELFLNPGLTVVNVHRTEEGSRGGIELEEVGG